jgi:hypothetical protein
MCLQNTLATEHFTTHIRGIWMPCNAYIFLHLHKTQGMNVSIHHFYDCSKPRVGMFVFTPSVCLGLLLHAAQKNGRSSLRKRKCRYKIPLRMNILRHPLQTNGRCAWCMSWCLFSSNRFLNDIEHTSQRFGWYVGRTGCCSFRVLCQKRKIDREKERRICKILMKISNIKFCENRAGGGQVVPCGQTNAAVVFHNCRHP